jgi:Uma2 family endonuclease
MSALLPADLRSAPRLNRDDAQRLVLANVTWPAYQKITQGLAEKPVRLTYDRGALELMVPSTGHERFKSLIGLVVCILAEELNRVIGSFGSFTHQREDLARALEPDQCFYLSHFPAVRGKREIDLARDPPPDLAIEIEISRSVLDRLSILAALMVPEVWRFDGERLRVLLLKKGRASS